VSFRDIQGPARIALGVLLIAVIAVIDWSVDLNLSFGFLYLFPMLLLGTAMTRWQVVIAAVACTWLSDIFDPFAFHLLVSGPQDILVFTALAGTGLFSYEVKRSRRREMENLRRVEAEATARRQAEEQLEFIIESSPAAILTIGSDSRVLRANSAAHRLLGVAFGALSGRLIGRYIPALLRVPFSGSVPQNFRTEMQCRGEREDGAVFLANVFFSTYMTPAGPRLAALIVDASEELREREEASLEQMMAGSRILVGAVSHEVRNVCGAIAVIYENLARSGMLHGNKDFEALGALVEALNKIASLELKQNASIAQIGGVDLLETLDDLRIVLEPYCREAGITVEWDVPAELPPVWADRHSLLQVLLNLTKNSERALEDADEKRITITVSARGEVVWIRVTDSGPGIAAPGVLFQPFQKGADATGLGLYLSRAFMRSFRGDLRHDAAVPGCSFVIELAVAGPYESKYGSTDKHRPHPAAVAR
jgi:two-component system sensor kinase FixL